MNQPFQPAVLLNKHCDSLFIKTGHLFLVLLSLLLTTNAIAQDGNGRTVKLKGFVTNQKGEPLSGVSIQVNGNGAAVVSEADGSFEINVPENAKVSISYVGYITQDFKAGNKNQLTLKFQLQTKKDLDEVVVVGYGTRRRSEVTGSMVSVSEQAIKDVPTQSLAKAIQGRAAGVDIQKVNGNSKPGAPVSILIRGSRSVKASNSPLIVVDGIPFSGNFNDLNPDDITNVEILKDASATAIYGSRGANGVLLVSTRRGKSGKASISYSGYAGATRPIGQWKMMDAQEFGLFKKWAKINGNITNGVPDYTGPDDPNLVKEFTSEELDILKSGSKGTDWQDLVTTTGILTNHQIGITGGSEQTQYAISGSYYRETGIYPGQAFERPSIKLSIDHQLGKIFKVGLSSLNSYAITRGESFDPWNVGGALRASPMISPWDPATGKLRDDDFLPASQSQVWNPLADLEPGAQTERRKRLGSFNTFYLDVNLSSLLKGLKYRFNAGAEIRSENYSNFYAKNTTVQKGTQSTADNKANSTTSWTLEHLLTYDNTFAKKHKVNVTGLFSTQQERSNGTTFTTKNIMVDGLENYNPEFGFDLSGSGSYNQWGLISYMGRVNYAYDDRYLLTLTMRSDGSSRLADGNKWKMFPSVAAAWNIHNEKFFHIDAINNLRLRASVGKVGNASISPYGTLAKLGTQTYNYGDILTRGIYLTTVGNNTLVWESTASVELALEFGILNNRIAGSVGVYKQFTEDLLLPQNLPLTTGISNPVLTNVGKTENKGIEVQVSANIVQAEKRNDFTWSADLSFSMNRGQITKLYGGITQDLANGWFIGQPIGVYYDYIKQGIWQNTKADTMEAQRLGLSTDIRNSVIGTIRVADRDGDNQITEKDKTFIGSPEPKWTGGMTNRVAYGGFDLTVVAYARWGSTLFSSIHGSGFNNTYQGVYNNLKARYWTPYNNENEYPKPTSGSTNPAYRSLLAYFDGSFLKIRTISLGYTLPPSLLKKMGARNIRVYSTVSDPFILFSPYKNHKYGGLDPESGGKEGSPYDGASVQTVTPPTWSLIFGLNVTL